MDYGVCYEGQSTPFALFMVRWDAVAFVEAIGVTGVTFEIVNLAEKEN